MQEEKAEEEAKVDKKIEPKEEGARRRRRGPRNCGGAAHAARELQAPRGTVRLRRPRRRCPAGADAEAAAAAAGVLARAQHFAPCPGPRGRGSGKSELKPGLSQSTLVQTETPFLRLPLLLCPTLLVPRDPSCPAESNFSRSARLVAALLSPETEASARCPDGAVEGERLRERQAGTSGGNGLSEEPHLSFCRRGPEPRLLPRTRLPGHRCDVALAPAALERGAGTERRAGTQSSHLTLLPPPSGLRSFQHPAPPSTWSRSQIGSPHTAGAQNRPCAPGWVWCAVEREGCTEEFSPGLLSNPGEWQSQTRLQSCGKDCT
ncbi:uncharacterized protein [Dasypus novemcinctus]|uniref:uncharacterized protein n=1 Tax=Dasypus novemcinctus TaxID=9361 RepID=UPI00265F1129|nr:uncharacterized protein LOC131276180 [Dasypus novemcinctus]